MTLPRHIEQVLRIRLWVSRHRLACLLMWVILGVALQVAAR